MKTIIGVLILSTLVSITRACLDVKSLSSPVNIINQMINSMLSLMDVRNDTETLRVIQVLQNSQQTQFKFILTVTDRSIIRNYIGIRSELVTVDGQDVHKITKFVQSDSPADVEALMAVSYSGKMPLGCLDIKQKFAAFYQSRNYLKEWMDANMVTSDSTEVKREVSKGLNSFFAQAPDQKMLIAKIESDNVICRKQLYDLTNQLQAIRSLQGMKKEVNNVFSKQAETKFKEELLVQVKSCQAQVDGLKLECVTSKDAIVKANQQMVDKLNQDQNDRVKELTEKFNKDQETIKNSPLKAPPTCSCEDLEKVKREIDASNKLVIDLRAKVQNSDLQLKKCETEASDQSTICSAKASSLEAALGLKGDEAISLRIQLDTCNLDMTKKMSEADAAKQTSDQKLDVVKALCDREKAMLQEIIQKLQATPPAVPCEPKTSLGASGANDDGKLLVTRKEVSIPQLSPKEPGKQPTRENPFKTSSIIVDDDFIPITSGSIFNGKSFVPDPKVLNDTSKNAKTSGSSNNSVPSKNDTSNIFTKPSSTNTPDRADDKKIVSEYIKGMSTERRQMIESNLLKLALALNAKPVALANLSLDQIKFIESQTLQEKLRQAGTTRNNIQIRLTAPAEERSQQNEKDTWLNLSPSPSNKAGTPNSKKNPFEIVPSSKSEVNSTITGMGNSLSKLDSSIRSQYQYYSN